MNSQALIRKYGATSPRSFARCPIPWPSCRTGKQRHMCSGFSRTSSTPSGLYRKPFSVQAEMRFTAGRASGPTARVRGRCTDRRALRRRSRPHCEGSPPLRGVLADRGLPIRQGASLETSVGSATIVRPAPDDRCIINGAEVVSQPGGVHRGRTTGRVVGAFTGVPGSMACSGFVYQRRAGGAPTRCSGLRTAA